ncbi:MAG: bacterioferritin [Deltaproteobacteria bacterium]|nr:bacterioferritin [Deltaproteobacteria bacterium]
MKGDEQVIDALNHALRSEVTAILQYFLHAEMCSDWGYTKLAAFVKKSSIEEMIHAEKLIERILFLEGHPAMAPMAPVNVGRTVPEQFKNDLALEHEAVKTYNGYVKLCSDKGDNVSRDLFLQLVTDEERHVDFLETQLSMVDQLGLPNYLVLQSTPAGAAGAADAGGGGA